MEISTQLAVQTYGAAKPATEPQAGEGVALSAAQEFASILEHGESMAQQAVTSGADPHALVEALAQSELAIQTAVTVRDKVVEAYQEVLRMPV